MRPPERIAFFWQRARERGLTSVDRAVLCAIVDLTESRSDRSLTYTQIAEHAWVSVATVKRSLAHLRALGLIGTRVEREGGRIAGLTFDLYGLWPEEGTDDDCLHLALNREMKEGMEG